MTNPDLCECIASHMRRMIQEFDELMQQTADQTFTRGGQTFNGDPLAIGGGDGAARVGGGGGGAGGLGTPAMLMLLFGFLYMFMVFVARPKTNRIDPPRKPHQDNSNGGGGGGPGFGGGPGPDLIM